MCGSGDPTRARFLLGGGQEGWALNRSAVRLLGLCVHIPFLGFRTSWSIKGDGNEQERKKYHRMLILHGGGRSEGWSGECPETGRCG